MIDLEVEITTALSEMYPKCIQDLYNMVGEECGLVKAGKTALATVGISSEVLPTLLTGNDVVISLTSRGFPTTQVGIDQFLDRLETRIKEIFAPTEIKGRIVLHPDSSLKQTRNFRESAEVKSAPVICDGCNVQGVHEHQCHRDNARVGDEPTGKPCQCQSCTELFRM